MIGQYLSNTNESATIPILQIFLKLNKAYGLFSSKKFNKMNIVVILFIFDKYYLIID